MLNEWGKSKMNLFLSPMPSTGLKATQMCTERNESSPYKFLLGGDC